MDALRIILIILGVIIVVAIYLWDRHQQRQKLNRQIVPMPEQDDEPGIIITTRTQYDDDVSADLADLKRYMGSQGDGMETEEDLASAPFTAAHEPDAMIDVGPTEQLDVLLSEDSPAEDATPAIDDIEAGQQSIDNIISLHIVAAGTDSLAGEDIRNAAEATGFKFGEMDIYHYFSDQRGGPGAPLFSLVDMYEPGYFEMGRMGHFSTRGISLFARFGGGESAVADFEVMLDTARKLATHLDGELLGSDRQSLIPSAEDEIRHRLRGETG